jgi:nucleotide-binding universal stress UspA family protein
MTTNSIVFPTDFSANSVTGLQWALDMADKLGATITCLYVVEEPHIYSSLDMGTASIPTTGELVESAEKRLKSFVEENLANATIEVEHKVVVGYAATEIVNYARDTNAAMIVITTRGYTGMKHVLLGSTTEDVVRNAPCPVLSVRSND